MTSMINDLNSNDVKCAYKKIQDNEIPLFVPLIIRKDLRTELRQFLINNKVYLPIHWPVSDMHLLDEKSSALYDSELSCVCDQRYDSELDVIPELIGRFLLQC